VSTDAAERARRLEEERKRLREAAPLGLEAEEASVSFVIRERPGPPMSHAKAASHAKAEHASPSRAAPGMHRGQGYVPHKGLGEEAEVMVVKPGKGRAVIVDGHRSRAGRLRRLLRSLSRD
jgi:hypothetical protein